MKWIKTRRASFIPVFLLALMACGPIDSFEKNVAIPGNAWSSDFVPEVSINISDTSSAYNLYLVLRHTNAYRWNNIWINFYIKHPGQEEFKSQRLEVLLATDEKGWLGSGMDDIFEQRQLIFQDFKFPDTGTYTFRIEQIMREDPLKEVLNAGIRLEKIQ
jgi:gliding motility-associated lipoprotein GldH